jgi:hypothetical protein
MVYYLENLKIMDIYFLIELLEEYHKNNSGPETKLPIKYHSLKTKVDRLKNFARYFPNETDTPKTESKFHSTMKNRANYLRNKAEKESRINEADKDGGTDRVSNKPYKNSAGKENRINEADNGGGTKKENRENNLNNKPYKNSTEMKKTELNSSTVKKVKNFNSDKETVIKNRADIGIIRLLMEKLLLVLVLFAGATGRRWQFPKMFLVTYISTRSRKK